MNTFLKHKAVKPAAATTISIILFCFASQIVSFEAAPILLQEGYPQVVSMNPYEFYEVLVPVDSITAETDYLIRASY